MVIQRKEVDERQGEGRVHLPPMSEASTADFPGEVRGGDRTLFFSSQSVPFSSEFFFYSQLTIWSFIGWFVGWLVYVIVKGLL